MINFFFLGKEVADYCKENFEEVLKSDPSIKTDIIQALKNTFKKIDVSNNLKIYFYCYFLIFLGRFRKNRKG